MSRNEGVLGFSLEVALIPLREEGLDKGFADADRSTFQLENNMNNSGDNQEQCARSTQPGELCPLAF